MTKLEDNPLIEGLGGIQARVVAYSMHPSQEGKPLVTLQLRYPRFIHSEFMTHRVFQRNAQSSRAIPVAKMLEQVRNDPAMPVHWGKNMPGMQAKEELQGESREDAIENWKQAAVFASQVAQSLMEDGAHKQIVNRILEPFQFISVIVTATEWDNFFELRDHEDAQPEIRVLAQVMKQAIDAAKPRLLNFGEWHLPYVDDLERDCYNNDSLIKLSAARCARVSYLKHDGSAPSAEEDFALFDRLVGSVPLHASPIEHQATADGFDVPHAPGSWAHPELHGNFVGWVQNRKVYERQLANPLYTFN